MKLQSPLLRQLVHSKSLDLVGALLIFGVCYFRKFHETIYHQGAIQFGIPFEELPSYIQQGAFPLGIVSTAFAIFSLIGTRLVGKQNNFGNVIGVITAITSGSIDYLFGNASAIITYPVTFFIHSYAVKNWAQGEQLRKRDTLYYIIIIGGLVVGFAMVHLGAYLFGGRTDAAFLAIVSVVFGISLGGNFCNALKYEETFLSWVAYNTVQLIKNFMQANLANVVKYIFYLFNAFITLFDWKLNGDVKTT